MSHPNAQDLLTPAQWYVISVARATVEAHQAYGAEQIARWIAPPAGTSMVSDIADLPGALVFAYELAVRQIGELLAIFDMLTGGGQPGPQADYGTAREQAYVERRVIQAALAGSNAARKALVRIAAEALDEWRSAASDAERARLMRAAEEAVNLWGAS